MAYTATVWVDTTTPAIAHNNRNHAETQHQKVLDDAPVDQAAGTPSLRTLGDTSIKAKPGNHDHI